jgi:tripeptidyl-peptidase-1
MAKQLVATATVLLFFGRMRASMLHSMEPPVSVLPSGWTVTGPAPRTQMMELTFAVKQQGLQELTERLLRTSDPSSPDYGQHFANDEVQRLTAPQPHHLAAVEHFLQQKGLQAGRATPNGDFVVATVTVAEAEELLSARYVTLLHNTGKEVSRVLEGYQLPAEVAAAVDFVAPTTHVPDVRWSSSDVAEAQGANTTIPNLSLFNSPKNLRSLYQVGSAEGQAASNKQAVTAFLGQGYSELSLKGFWRLMCGGIHCGKGSPKLVGDKTKGLPGVESMLDIETVTGVAGNVESEFWGFAGKSPDNPQNEPFLKWLMQLSSTSDADVPKIFSTS